MKTYGCVNGSLDGVNYSSPVPIIGVYIAAASLACVATMIYDTVVAGIIKRRWWLPCKYFKLNSVTLTLLAITTKLPVDLTSPMPGRWDQLSKLTGTTIICIAMGFVTPSLGLNGESECFTNMVALSIFVITVAINISIQLYTGVIFMFFAEHVTMLGLMLLLLLMLWNVSFRIKLEKRIAKDELGTLLSKGSRGMFQRLKQCSLHAYCSNPQLKIGSLSMNAAISTICVGCTGIIIEAATRSLVLKQLEFCQGVSDYGWSTPAIVVTQIAAIIAGTVAIAIRLVALFGRMDIDRLFENFWGDLDLDVQQIQTLKSKGFSLNRLLNIFAHIATKITYIAQLLFLLPSFLWLIVFGNHIRGDWVGRIGNLKTYFSGISVEEGIDYLKGLRDQIASSKSPNYILQILCQKTPTPDVSSQNTPTPEDNPDVSSQKTPTPEDKPNVSSQKTPTQDVLSNNILHRGGHSIEVCSLSLALLVKIAEASMPKEFLEPMLNVFYEAKDDLCFIDKTLLPKTSKNIDKLAYTKSVWMDGSFTCLVPSGIRPAPDHLVAVDIIEELKEKMDSKDPDREIKFILRCEARVVIDFILAQSYTSIQELYIHIEQLFVDLLHALYAQLPFAIHESLKKTPVEEFEESARAALVILFKIGSLDCQKSWSFPSGVTCMTDTVTEVSAPRSFYLNEDTLKLENILLARHQEGAHTPSRSTCLPPSGSPSLLDLTILSSSDYLPIQIPPAPVPVSLRIRPPSPS